MSEKIRIDLEGSSKKFVASLAQAKAGMMEVGDSLKGVSEKAGMTDQAFNQMLTSNFPKSFIEKIKTAVDSMGDLGDKTDNFNSILKGMGPEAEKVLEVIENIAKEDFQNIGSLGDAKNNMMETAEALKIISEKVVTVKDAFQQMLSSNIPNAHIDKVNNALDNTINFGTRFNNVLDGMGPKAERVLSAIKNVKTGLAIGGADPKVLQDRTNLQNFNSPERQKQFERAFGGGKKQWSTLTDGLKEGLEAIDAPSMKKRSKEIKKLGDNWEELIDKVYGGRTDEDPFGKTFQENLDSAKQSATSFFNRVIEDSANLNNTFINVTAKIDGFKESIEKAGAATWALDKIKTKLKSVSEAATQAKNKMSAVSSMGGAISGMALTAINGLQMLGSIFGLVGGIIGGVVKTIIGIVSALGSIIGSVFRGIWSVISVIASIIVGAIKGVINIFIKLGQTIVNVVGSVIKKMFTNFATAAQRFAKATSNIGRQLAWFGFRLTMMGRILQRSLTNNLKKALAVFGDWSGTISDLGLAMGFLAAQGLLTGNMTELFLAAMVGFLDPAMQWTGAMGAIKALLIVIGKDVVPILVGAILDLVDAMYLIWKEHGPAIVDALKVLVDDTLPRLIELLIDVAPAILKGLVEGFKNGARMVGEFLDLIGPSIGMLAEWMGTLIAMSPVITAIGFALYALSVPLQALSSGILIADAAIRGIIGFILGGFLTTIPLAIGALIVLGTALEGFGYDTNKIMGDIGDAFDWALGKLNELLGGVNFDGILDAYDRFMNNFIPVVESAFSRVADIVERIFGRIDWDESALAFFETWDRIVLRLIELWEGIRPSLVRIWNAIPWGEMLDYALNILGGLWERLKTWWTDSGMGTWIATKLEEWINFGIAQASAAIDWAKLGFGDMLDFLDSSELAQNLATWRTNVETQLGNVWETITSIWTGTLGRWIYIYLGIETWRDIGTLIVSALATIWNDAILPVWSSSLDRINLLMEKKGLEISKGILKGIIKGFAIGGANPIIASILRLMDVNVEGIGSNFIDNQFADNLLDVENRLKDNAESFANVGAIIEANLKRSGEAFLDAIQKRRDFADANGMIIPELEALYEMLTKGVDYTALSTFGFYENTNALYEQGAASQEAVAKAIALQSEISTLTGLSEFYSNALSTNKGYTDLWNEAQRYAIQTGGGLSSALEYMSQNVHILDTKTQKSAVTWIGYQQALLIAQAQLVQVQAELGNTEVELAAVNIQMTSLQRAMDNLSADRIAEIEGMVSGLSKNVATLAQETVGMFDGIDMASAQLLEAELSKKAGGGSGSASWSGLYKGDQAVEMLGIFTDLAERGKMSADDFDKALDGMVLTTDQMTAATKTLDEAQHGLYETSIGHDAARQMSIFVPAMEKGTASVYRMVERLRSLSDFDLTKFDMEGESLMRFYNILQMLIDKLIALQNQVQITGSYGGNFGNYTTGLINPVEAKGDSPIQINITNSFDNVEISSDIDINRLTDEVNRRIASGIEGVLRR